MTSPPSDRERVGAPRGTRDDPQSALLMGESQTSVQFTSVMAAVVVFFAALLLQADTPDKPAQSNALALLFVAAFAFLYATLLYANTSAELARPLRGGVPEGCGEQHRRGDVLSEFLGVYPLVAAIPLAVLGSTGDGKADPTGDHALAWAVAGIAVVGLVIYHAAGQTIAHREGTRPRARRLVVDHWQAALTMAFIGVSMWLATQDASIATGVATGAFAGALTVATVVGLWPRRRPRLRDRRIRPAVEEDLAHLTDLDRRVFTEVREEPYAYADLRQFHELFPDLFLVAEDGRANLVGYALGAIGSDRRSGWLLSLGVEPAARGQGIGSGLTSTVLDRLDELGADTISLSVQPASANAIRLYERLGFERVATVPDYFGPGEPRIVMRRTPPPG